MRVIARLPARIVDWWTTLTGIYDPSGLIGLPSLPGALAAAAIPGAKFSLASFDETP